MSFTKKCAKLISSALFFLACSEPINAQQSDIARALNEAQSSTPTSGAHSTFDLEGCILRQTIVAPNYCARVGVGEGGRTITRLIDLGEVVQITSGTYQEKFSLEFGLDIPKTNRRVTIMERLILGKTESFERSVERRRQALDETELATGTYATQCDSEHLHFAKRQPQRFYLDREPEGWERLIALAESCRASGNISAR